MIDPFEARVRQILIATGRRWDRRTPTTGPGHVRLDGGMREQRGVVVDVAEFKQACQQGKTLNQLAELFGVSRSKAATLADGWGVQVRNRQSIETTAAAAKLREKAGCFAG